MRLAILFFVTFLLTCCRHKCDCNNSINYLQTFSLLDFNFNSAYLNKDGKLYCLNEAQVQEIILIASDSSNYQDGDCGTTFKEGYFYFNMKKKDGCSNILKIAYGCNISQLYFSPSRSEPKSGLLTPDASEQLNKLVSEIIE